MTPDLDIYRSANELIKRHGLKGASDHATDRIATLREFQDPGSDTSPDGGPDVRLAVQAG